MREGERERGGGGGEKLKMCESNFRRALLEQPFRVWLSGSVCEYDVTLTPVSVILRPCTPGKGGGAAAAAAAASCCSRICSRTPSAKVEVFGRDLLSCRPAHGMPTETKVRDGEGEYVSEMQYILCTYRRQDTEYDNG